MIFMIFAIFLIIVFVIFVGSIPFMITFANIRFDTIKDLIPDVSLYNYKDPLTSHLHVGAVVMMSIIIISIFVYGIWAICVEVIIEEVIEFFKKAGLGLLYIGIVVAILAALCYGLSAIVNAIRSYPVPQINFNNWDHLYEGKYFLTHYPLTNVQFLIY